MVIGAMFKYKLLKYIDFIGSLRGWAAVGWHSVVFVTAMSLTVVWTLPARAQLSLGGDGFDQPIEDRVAEVVEEGVEETVEDSVGDSVAEQVEDAVEEAIEEQTLSLGGDGIDKRIEERFEESVEESVEDGAEEEVAEACPL